ncbi:MAG TPA: hypothetical protein VFS20_04170 [Longimicrobium sp.]|nr:hypothetical protein [Longimicrobium sp.]
MQPWRRNYILFMGERPWRLMAVIVGICVAIALFIGNEIWTGDPTPIVLPPERAWQQPVIDAVGSRGYVYLMSSIAGLAFGLAVWLKLWLTGRRGARWIRENEAAGYSV